MKDSLSAIPSSSSLSVSLAHTRSRNHTSSISVRTFLLFPRQQWQRILPRRTQPMTLAVVWVVVLLGSVELAACVCACFRFMLMDLWGMLRVHICTHAFVPARICAEEHRDEFCVICLWVKRRCRVSMREMACETRRGKGCQGIFKAFEQRFSIHFN